MTTATASDSEQKNSKTTRMLASNLAHVASRPQATQLSPEELLNWAQKLTDKSWNDYENAPSLIAGGMQLILQTPRLFCSCSFL
jgi:hypothetical protein